MIQVRKDEARYLKENGLGHYVLAKTCHGKRFAVEDKKVLAAIKKYNASIVMEG